MDEKLKKVFFDEFQKMNLSNEDIKRELLYYVRKVGMKLNAFLPPRNIWEEPKEIYEKFYCIKNGIIKPNIDKFVMDMREVLGYDRPLRIIAQIILGKIREMKPCPEFIFGYELSSFPIIGAILTLNDIFFPDQPLEACFVRKRRKQGDLRRIIEGSRYFSGRKAVFIDDIINNGNSLKRAEELARLNNITLLKAFFAFSFSKKISTKIPFEALISYEDVLKKEIKTPELINQNKKNYNFSNGDREKNETKEIPNDSLSEIDMLGVEENKSLSKEDIELVKLARDTVSMFVFSDYKKTPILKADEKGSFGYIPFLGKYLKEKGPVFVKINKREFKNGKWMNRLRGCMSSNVMDKDGTFAENVINSSKLTCAKASKDNMGSLHKPIWAEELGSLSFFVYIVEKIEKTDAKTPEELERSGHNVKKHGLLAVKENHSWTILEGMSRVSTEEQLRVVLKNVDKGVDLKNYSNSQIELYRIFGRWLWLPERSMKYYFE